jgi:hypothetical protein
MRPPSEPACVSGRSSYLYLLTQGGSLYSYQLKSTFLLLKLSQFLPLLCLFRTLCGKAGVTNCGKVAELAGKKVIYGDGMILAKLINCLAPPGL